MEPINKGHYSGKKLKKKAAALMMAAVLTVGLLAGCGQTQVETVTGAAVEGAVVTPAAEVLAESNGAAAVAAAQSFEFDASDFETTWDEAGAVKVAFNDGSISISGQDQVQGQVQGATAEGSVLRITKAGTYVLSGSLENGRVIVAVGSDEDVRLILNGVNISSVDAPAIEIEAADRTTITLVEGTTNILTMAASEAASAAIPAEDENVDANEADGVVYSKGDLTLNGNGVLMVNGTIKHGIVSKDDLRITGGGYVVKAAGDAIRGKDLIAVAGGNFEIEAGSDAFLSNNDEAEDRGYILVEDGTFKFKAAADGFQATSALVIEDGDFDLETGGGSVNGVQAASNAGAMGKGQWPGDGTRPARGLPPEAAVTEGGPSANSSASVAADEVSGGDWAAPNSDSAKALKSDGAVVISGGTFAVDSADDSIHSNGSILIQGGVFDLASGDDGIHADTVIVIQGGEVRITKSYEGVESASIEILGGELEIVSSDDGINTSGGADGSSVGGRPGQNAFDASDGSGFFMAGGVVVVYADGDGVDLNGSGEMTGGTLLVHGPTSSGNGALDYNGDFVQMGGLLIAAGSSGMVQGPVASSSTLSAQVFLTSQAAGTLVQVVGEDGAEVVAFRPAKAFSSIVVASPEFESGMTYKVYVGGNSAGEEVGGLVSGSAQSGGSAQSANGIAAGGTEVMSFELDGTVTQVVQEGASAGGMGGMGGGKRVGN
ncbi:carbohydrate-binding domain-containing protein [Acidaminobacter hydrogenoformans]|uniref:Carbohydrate-binding domain-containing protein n=1 Tax=Acidaminobacter hydrogenoformans DSM 2784 TaxID=1120920 RepID=A0A1G5RXC4_9FIRM|nr:carbohydrate-binding domain-containing protein [Acidaminobacter hydrogenoformans]SCZ78762.1 protein of unknown function [Acidaminobacter hydrogenoformans DSM 2784]